MTTATPVKERPILFSGPMVRAILEGRKTQTRRVVKPQPKVELFPFIGRDDKPTGEYAFVDHPRVVSKHVSCPYGVPGDRLWVRETWCKYSSKVIYRANYPDGLSPISDGIGGPWRPSIFMPRWASRITLEVTKVRVERLQDISEADIDAEGAPFAYAQDGGAPKGGLAAIRAEKIGRSFRHGIWAERWDAINAKRGFGWDANPWVWAIGFRRVTD